MIIYRYTSQTQTGKTIGVVTATNRQEAERILRQRGEIILRLDEVASGPENSPYFTLKTRSPLEKYWANYRIGKATVELFLRQLAVLLKGGVPILTAIQTLATQQPYCMKRAAFCLANQIRDGVPLSTALQEEMGFLGEVTIGLITAGETNGEIDKMCAYAADLMERRRLLKNRIIQAIFYPSIVIFVLIGVLIFLFMVVIPKIMTFLAQRSGQLPGITQALVDCVDYFNAHWILFCCSPFLIFGGIYILHRIPFTGYFLDFIVLHFPLFGKVFRSSANAVMTRILGTLLHSGINIISALHFTENALSNRFYKTEIKLITQLIAMGHPLSTGLRVSRLHRYIPLAESMISVGENTGQMDEGLLQISEFAEEELDRRITLLSKLIEPVLLGVIAGIVGFVYIAFFMAMMSLSRST